MREGKVDEHRAQYIFGAVQTRAREKSNTRLNYSHIEMFLYHENICGPDWENGGCVWLL